MDGKEAVYGFGGGHQCPPGIDRRGRVIPGPWGPSGPSLVEDLPGRQGEIVGVRFPPQPVLTLEERLTRLEERMDELEAKELARACGSRWKRLVAAWKRDP